MPPRVFGRPPRSAPPAPRPHPSERLSEHSGKLGVPDVSRRDDQDVPRDVVLAKVGEEALPAQSADGFLGPLDRPSERVRRVEVGREHVVDQLFRRVFDHADLFDDHLALAFELGLVEQRVQDDVRQQVDHLFHVFVQNLGVEAGVFLRREGVHLPADRVDRQGDLARGPVLGPLEDEMFDEMRRPVQRRRFVAAAAAEPHPQGHRADVRYALGEQGDSVGEGFLARGGVAQEAGSISGENLASTTAS